MYVKDIIYSFAHPPSYVIFLPHFYLFPFLFSNPILCRKKYFPLVSMTLKEETCKYIRYYTRIATRRTEKYHSGRVVFIEDVSVVAP